MIRHASYYCSCFSRLYDTLAHIAVDWCVPFNANHVTNMSHLQQHGRGWLIFSRTTRMYYMWRCKKWTRSVLHIKSLPTNPPTGQYMSRAVRGNETR